MRKKKNSPRISGSSATGRRAIYKGEGDFFNRSLKLDYVFKNMPEFIYYIRRLKVNDKELKRLVDRIEKDRSYIRRFNVEKKEVKKLIIRLEGMQQEKVT